MTFLEHGRHEHVKYAWHLGGLVFAAGAALYGFCAFAQRREGHLLVTGMVYTGLTLWEAEKVTNHIAMIGGDAE